MTSLYYTARVQEEGQTEQTDTHRALPPILVLSIKSQIYQYFTRSPGLPWASAASIHPSTLIWYSEPLSASVTQMFVWDFSREFGYFKTRIWNVSVCDFSNTLMVMELVFSSDELCAYRQRNRCKSPWCLKVPSLFYMVLIVQHGSS